MELIPSVCKWINIEQFHDSRGTLSSIDFSKLPFLPARIFYITNTPLNTSRGGHAHSYGEQLLICISGKIHIELQFEKRHEEVLCIPNGLGLLITPKIWSKQHYLTTNSSLLVLCSHPYDSEAYINNNEFI